jgi:hypothetical protein
MVFDDVVRVKIDDNEYLPFNELDDRYISPRYPNMKLEDFFHAEIILETMPPEERSEAIHTIRFGNDLGMLLISVDGFIKIFEALPKLRDRAFVEESFSRTNEILDDETWEWCINITDATVLHSDTPKAGYVYLIQSPTGSYKIGRSKNIANRLKTFNVKLPFEIEIEHVISCSDYRAAERELHKRYADKRVNGEWFALTRDDVEQIKAIVSM